MNGLRLCPQCHQWLPEICFYVRRDRNAHQSWCKQCMRAEHKTPKAEASSRVVILLLLRYAYELHGKLTFCQGFVKGLENMRVI